MKWCLIYIWFFVSPLPQTDSLDYQGVDSLETSTVDTNYIPDPMLTTDTFVVNEFQSGFKDRYKTADFEYEKKEKEAIKKLKEGDEIPDMGNFFAFLPTLFKILVGLLLLYAVYMIVSVWLGKKGNWLFQKKNDPLLIYQEDVDISTETDLPSKIKEALEQKNYRLAIRYHYLYLLQTMTQNGIISYNKEKTNSDYRYEIKNQALAEAFDYTSYIYDYTWYGGFEMSSTQYDLAKLAFEDTIKKVRP
jgi:flagellar basal body-associated protein FliL